MGKFVIKTGKSGVRFNLLAGNGQVIARPMPAASTGSTASVAAPQAASRT